MAWAYCSYYQTAKQKHRWQSYWSRTTTDCRSVAALINAHAALRSRSRTLTIMLVQSWHKRPRASKQIKRAMTTCKKEDKTVQRFLATSQSATGANKAWWNESFKSLAENRHLHDRNRLCLENCILTSSFVVKLCIVLLYIQCQPSNLLSNRLLHHWILLQTKLPQVESTRTHNGVNCLY